MGRHVAWVSMLGIQKMAMLAIAAHALMNGSGLLSGAVEEFRVSRGMIDFRGDIGQIGRTTSTIKQQSQRSSYIVSMKSMHRFCKDLSEALDHDTAERCWVTLFDTFPNVDRSPMAFQVHYDYARHIENGSNDRTSAAKTAYERALAVMTEPSSPLSLDAMNRLGLLWQKLSRPHVAIEVFRQSLQWHPHECALRGNLASAYLELGNVAAALAAAAVALKLEPHNAALHHNMGNIYQRAGDMLSAMSHWQKAVEIDPQNPNPLFSLGIAAGNQGLSDTSTAYFAKSVVVASQHAPALRDLARLQLATALLPRVYDSTNDIHQIRQTFTTALEDLMADSPLSLGDNPIYTTGCGSMGYYLVYQGGPNKHLRRTLAQIYEKSMPGLKFEAPHVRAARHHTFQFPSTARFVDARLSNVSAAVIVHRRIRVGILSAFMYHHSVGLLMQGVLTRLSNATYELVLLRCRPWHADHVTDRVSRHMSRVVQLPNDVFHAQQVVADLALDILLFTELGMDASSYFLAFATLALRSVLFWGHAVTSGLSTVDYFVTSTHFQSNPDEFTETLYPMQSLTTVFHRPRFSFHRSLLSFLPADDDGRVMYLIPQTLYKLHPAMDSLVAAILAAHRNSYLVLLEGAVPHLATQIRRRLGRVLSLQDLESRVVFAPYLSTDAFLTLCQVADVVLDPFPVGGGRSSFEVFSVGTPIVAHTARTSIAQLTAAMYTKMNITACCVAATDEAYVATALALGQNASYRQEMSTLIQSRSSVLFESDASTVASVMDDWNRCFHTILAMPPPPRPTPASTVAIPFGFRLQLFGQLSVEVVMHANETPTQVGATIAALYGLEPLYQCYIQTLLFHGVQRWRQNEAQLAITTDAFPGRTPPLDIYVGDDVALAVQYHLWRYNHRVPGRDVAVAVASIRHKLAFSDASAPWIAARGVQHQPPRSAVQAHDAPQLSTRQCLTVALTTCKRLSLFLATMKSFLPYANSTAVAICMILVLDDHSSAADRRVMQESFPTVQFVFTRRKGHAHSLNLLLDLVSTPFVLYLEDDWQWLQDLPHHPIAHALAVLDSDPTLVQVLLNTQFSGWPRTMHDSHPFDVYFRHEFGIVDHAFGYWPGFSLNPGVWNLRRLRQCPRLTFNERSDVFEREFSLAVWQCGLHVAMLPYTTAVHIGAAPGTNGSAYALNGMPRRFD